MSRTAKVVRLTLPPGRRVLVISDIHGNLPFLRGVLSAARYTPGDVATARTRHPGAELLIHPEAPVKVAALAEAVGSTKAIIEAVSRAEPGTHLLIGTEEHLVRRLAAAHPDLDIHPLRPIICQDMGRTTPEALLRVLQAWPDDTLVRVPDALLPDAHACVQRMLALA